MYLVGKNDTGGSCDWLRREAVHASAQARYTDGAVVQEEEGFKSVAELLQPM